MKNFINVGPTEDEQEQQIKNWIKENGLQIVAGVAIGLSAIWGLDAYKNYQHTQALEARSHYLSLSVNPNNSTSYNTLQNDFSESAYSQEAALVLARDAVVAENYEQALSYLTPLTSAEDTTIAHTAKLRVASIHLEQQAYDKALSALSIDKDSQFSGLFNEAKADVYVAQGKLELAKQHYQLAKAQISQDSQLQALIQIKLDDLN